jgi:hypothetical protein
MKAIYLSGTVLAFCVASAYGQGKEPTICEEDLPAPSPGRAARLGFGIKAVSDNSV